MTTYSNYSKPTHSTHPFAQNWSPQDLADAVPRKLSELAPELVNFGPGNEASNSVVPSPFAFDWRRSGYRRAAELPAFIRVR